ncbi:hypothetical protein [Ciceribacter sp. RN22]|uniref:SMa0974 family conjugal transfer regulator n=1 Tax=Ciceribacter sp. RN22 TaxID=2954932 RepID=UPI0020926436|nr:hypothetical protein [Ciceribacter sp. RN22]MCO6181045.1 hypothetical protein [Ciceribacter sp. RN22]
MYEHIAEAFVRVLNAASVAERVCASTGDYCQSIDAAGADMLLSFTDARAILRLTNEGLHLRVEARDFITFHGIRTLLLGRLFAIVVFESEAVEWRPVGNASCASDNIGE